MKKHLLALLPIAVLGLSSSGQATMPRTIEEFEIQTQICSRGLEMILAGATDQEELDFFNVELERNGWVGENDLDDFMMLCNAFKAGYLYAQD